MCLSSIVGDDLAMDSRLHSWIQTESMRWMETEDMKRVEGMFACELVEVDGRMEGAMEFKGQVWKQISYAEQSLKGSKGGTVQFILEIFHYLDVLDALKHQCSFQDLHS